MTHEGISVAVIRLLLPAWQQGAAYGSTSVVQGHGTLTLPNQSSDALVREPIAQEQSSFRSGREAGRRREDTYIFDLECV